MQNRLCAYKNQLFYLAYMIMIINATLIKNINSSVSKIFIIIYISLFFINTILKQYTIKEFILIHLGYLIAFIVFLNSKEKDLLIISIVVLSSSQVNFKEIVKIDFLTRLAGVTSTILLYFIGITKDFIMYRIDQTTNMIEIRHSLGFIHPNTLSIHIFIIVIAYIYLRNKQLKITEYILLFGIIYIFGEITGSRTATISIVIISLFLSLNKIICLKNKKIIKFILMYSTLICTMVSFIFTLLYKYDIELINKINEILTGRIKSASYFFDTYGFSLLGQDVHLVSIVQFQQTSDQMRILDNLYMSLGIRSGIIFLIIYNLLYFKLNKLLVENEYWCEVIFIFAIAIYGFVEKIAISPEANFTAILLSLILFSSNYDKSKSNQLN